MQKRVTAVLATGLRTGRRLRRRPVTGSTEAARSAVQRVAGLRLSGRSTAMTALFALANWALDVLCPAFALQAVGASVPWAGLILIWAAGVGVSA